MTSTTRQCAETVLATASRAGLRISLAESCTGGLIAAALTAVPGCSSVVERGFVTYSNEAKTELLGVPADLIAREGAVSEAVARAMAEGALSHSHADAAISVTGIAGPTGATETKPLGLVHLAVARTTGRTLHERHVFTGDRDAVRIQATNAALALLDRALSET